MKLPGRGAFLAALLALAPAAAPGAQQSSLFDMAEVRGGTFLMGDDSGSGRADERPAHPVTVPDFFLANAEVTVGQFRRFVTDTGYRTSAEVLGGWLVWTGRIWERKFNASWRTPYFPQTEQDPVVMVSWIDAAAFCNWLSRREGRAPFYGAGEPPAEDWSADGYRLPTEAEWEYAARRGGWRGQGEEGIQGDDGPRANVADEALREAFPGWPFRTWNGYRDGAVFTAPVGTFRPDALGRFDMAGNAWEWCNDWYGGYAPGPQADPRGPSTGLTRCLRGGGWTDEPGVFRPSFRGGRLPDGRGVNGGFRPARRDR